MWPGMPEDQIERSKSGILAMAEFFALEAKVLRWASGRSTATCTTRDTWALVTSV